MPKQATAEHDDGFRRSPATRSQLDASGSRSAAPSTAGSWSALVKNAAAGKANGAGSGRAKAVGATDWLREIQKTYGNAYAQKVLESYRPARGPVKGASNATEGSGASGGAVDEAHGLPPAASVAALLSPSGGEPTTSRGGAKSVPALGRNERRGGKVTPPKLGAQNSGKAKIATATKGKAVSGTKDQRALTRQDAGGGPIGGGRDRGGGGGGGGAKSPRSPDEDASFQDVKKKAKAVGAREASHPPAASKAAAAQGAAVGPPNEVASKAAANQAAEMNQQQPKAFDRASFKAALMAKVADLVPKNLEQADQFKESGKAGEIKGAVSSEVASSKEGSERDIKSTTAQAPNASGIEAKPVTPLGPTGPGMAPGSIGATAAAPKPKTDAEISQQEGSKKLEDDWKKTDLDDKDIASANEPKFQKTLDDKKGAQKDAVQGPAAYKKAEQGALALAEQQAEGGAGAKLLDMHAGRAGALGKVATGQGATKSKDERERARIAGEMQSIFDRTKTAVQTRLLTLDTEVNQAFDQGAEGARHDFESHIDARMRAYKRERYGGLFGGARWLKDKLLDMPDEVNVFYEEGRQLYVQKMETVIDHVAMVVETGLHQATTLIAKGKQEIDAYVAGLDPSLRQIGQEASAGFQSQFDELEQSVQEKSTGLVESLAKKYVENLGKLDERISEMKAANKGLVAAAAAAIKELVTTLLELKNMLLDVLAKAAAAIGKIIKQPIRFLGNLVAGVKQGILGFKAKIGQYLQEGLMGWLFGALGDAGISMPASFDFKGILSLVMQVLGLTYANIRARAVKIVGEPVVKALETAAEIFKILLTEGPAGLWNYIKEQIGNLKEMIIEGIKSFIIEKIVIAGITWLISMLNPASAFIKACKMIYDVVMFFVQRAKQIMTLVNAVIDSISAIADGAISVAAVAVEGALAKAVPVVLGFLASLLGLGGISEKIRSIIEKVRAPINKAIDWVINKAVSMVKAVGKFFAGGKKDTTKSEKKDPVHDAQVDAGLVAIDAAEAPLVKDGKISQEDAEKVATSVRRAHPVFKSINVVDAGEHWKYAYKASDGSAVSKAKKQKSLDPREGTVGKYPQAKAKTTPPTTKGAKHWESHHVPQKVLAKYLGEVYAAAGFPAKAAKVQPLGDAGHGLSAVLLSNTTHKKAHSSLEADALQALTTKIKTNRRNSPIFAVRSRESAPSTTDPAGERITAAARRSSIRRGVEEATGMTKDDEKNLTKKEMTNVFARVFRGGLASGAAGARGAVSPDNKIDNSLETTAESTWKLHLDPDK